MARDPRLQIVEHVIEAVHVVGVAHTAAVLVGMHCIVCEPLGVGAHVASGLGVLACGVL